MIFILFLSFLLLLVSLALIPLWTDAPLYHLPIATVSLIAVNVVLFLLTAGNLELLESLALWLGEGNITPLKWLTSIYVHIGIMHLLGNMMFLWVFGMVVEGKIGPLRFLAIYHAIGILQMALTQIFCLGLSETIPTAGASGAIFGLMAIAMVWAPSNNIICPISLALEIEVSLMMFAFYFLALNFLFAWLSEFVISSEVLHLIGAILGGIVGVVMFKRGMVDCEGYDLFAVMGGYEGDASRQPKRLKSKSRHQREEHEQLLAQQRLETDIREGVARFQAYLQDGHVDMAAAKFAAVRQLDPTLQMSQKNLLDMINAYLTQKNWDNAVPLMEEFITRFDSDNPTMRLNLARVLLVAKDRPRAALRTIQSLEPAQLDAKSKQICQQIRTQAKILIDEGEIELGD